MTPEQRASTLSAVKYLHQVRPIDPEEISEYVEGVPHPATVRTVIREHAFDLELVERPDGTFVPASDSSLEGSAGTIERLPQQYETILEDLLVERFGAKWWTGESGNQLRESIREMKEAYLHGIPVEYNSTSALGYASYHFPSYYAAIQYVLDDLVSAGLLPRILRVIDVGAGVGGPALGLLARLPEDALVDYHAVEPSAAAEVLAAMLSETGRNVHTTIHRERAETFELSDTYDLVLFANVVSELDDPTAVVERYAEAVAPDGSLLLLDPADRETSIGLRALERDLGNDLEVFSPTVRLWSGLRPKDRCWSFDVRPDLEVPSFQRRLDEAGGGSGEFVNVDVQYSYSILRSDGTGRFDFRPAENRFAPLAEAERNVTQRIDCVAIKLSRNLGSDRPLFLVGDGSQQIDHYVVLVKETSLNRALLEADYGDLLVLERVLLLWNDDEEAYNMVVDGETSIDRIRPKTSSS